MSGRTLSVRNVGANIVINSDPCKDYGYKGRAEPPRWHVQQSYICLFIGGRYKGGDVPEGMRLFSIPSGKWLKVHFTGGIKAFQQQFDRFLSEWLPAHSEYKWKKDGACMEWYAGADIQASDYQCGVMIPIE